MMAWMRPCPPCLMVSHALPTDFYAYGVALRGEDIWVANQNSQVQRSADGGATWDYELHEPLWRALAWSTPGEGWLISGTGAQTDGYTFRSHDGGAALERTGQLERLFEGEQLRERPPVRGVVVDDGYTHALRHGPEV